MLLSQALIDKIYSHFGLPKSTKEDTQFFLEDYLLSGAISLKEIKALDQKDFLRLISAEVHGLFTIGAIKPQDACLLPEALMVLLRDQDVLWGDLEKRVISLKELTTVVLCEDPQQKAQFFHPEIKKFWASGLLKVEEALQLTPLAFGRLILPQSKYLIEKGVLSLNDIFEDTERAQVLTNPWIQKLVANKRVPPEEAIERGESFFQNTCLNRALLSCEITWGGYKQCVAVMEAQPEVKQWLDEKYITPRGIIELENIPPDQHPAINEYCTRYPHLEDRLRLGKISWRNSLTVGAIYDGLALESILYLVLQRISAFDTNGPLRSKTSRDFLTIMAAFTHLRLFEDMVRRKYRGLINDEIARVLEYYPVETADPSSLLPYFATSKGYRAVCSAYIRSGFFFKNGEVRLIPPPKHQPAFIDLDPLQRARLMVQQQRDVQKGGPHIECHAAPNTTSSLPAR